MKFCDKLAMQRKKNNMSQEVLADRLGVSRQAVSKWELGTSMPDMERILELCKVLNCNLDDLVDDGVIGDTPKNDGKDKNIINTYLKEALNFVTKSLNMFWSMRFRDKVKCILEMLFLMIVIFIIWRVVGEIIISIFSGLLYILPGILYRIIHSVFGIIYSVFGLAIGIILVIHVFKIRYLDYFVTIEDNNVKEKSIETPVEEKKIENSDKDRKFIEKKKNKIIIRDPKHSTYGFFDFLAGVSIFIFKGLLIFVSIFGIISFMFLGFCETISTIKMFSSLFFVGTTLSILGALLVNYVCLKIIYNFIFNQKQYFKRIFYIFIIGLVLLGVGFGISFTTYLSFTEKSISNVEYDVYSEKIEMSDDLIFDFINEDNTEIVIDEEYDGIGLEVTYDKDGYIHLGSYRNYYYDGYYNVYRVYYYTSGNSSIDNIKYLINKIENEERIDSWYDGISGYKIIGNSSNIEKLKDNYNRLYE